MPMLATLTNSGRAAIAQAILARPLAFGWGIGDPVWDEMTDDELPSLVERTGLFNEIGRRLVTSASFAIPDDNGGIVVPVGTMPDGTVEEARYASSLEPTPYLYLRCNYDFGDAANTEIREIGVFMDTELADGLPPGQRYFTPAEIKNPGRLLAMQILRPRILRNPSVRQSIEFVLPI